MQDVDNRENYAWWGGGRRENRVYGNSLYFPHNFSVNLELLQKIVY